MDIDVTVSYPYVLLINTFYRIFWHIVNYITEVVKDVANYFIQFTQILVARSAYESSPYS